VRDPVIVQSRISGYDETFEVERVSAISRLEMGLYVMVPVMSEREAWSLIERLQSKSTESTSQ
jgi:hypothetical protein